MKKNCKFEEFTSNKINNFRNIRQNIEYFLCQFDKAHEYNETLNAAKTERFYAKPFVIALEHENLVTCIAKNTRYLECVFSASADAIISQWDINTKKCIKKYIGHKRLIRDITMTHNCEYCISCSEDRKIIFWKVCLIPPGPFEKIEDQIPTLEFTGNHAFRSIDHHWSEPCYVTAGSVIEFRDHLRQHPLQVFKSEANSFLSIRFNKIEKELFASSITDCSVSLYDLRMSTVFQKIIMKTRTNAIAWNPIDKFKFTAANEDNNLYTYDIRFMNTAMLVHQDFVAPVLDVDFSSTGLEFVAGSYDRTVRIFPAMDGHSREVFSAKRMQRVHAVKFSEDGAYVLSGSDDMNVRLWKSNNNRKNSILLSKKNVFDMSLMKRYGHMPKIKKLLKKRFMHDTVYGLIKLKRKINNTNKIKIKNIIAHSDPSTVKTKSIRKNKIIPIV